MQVYSVAGREICFCGIIAHASGVRDTAIYKALY